MHHSPFAVMISEIAADYLINSHIHILFSLLFYYSDFVLTFGFGIFSVFMIFLVIFGF